MGCWWSCCGVGRQCNGSADLVYLKSYVMKKNVGRKILYAFGFTLVPTLTFYFLSAESQSVHPTSEQRALIFFFVYFSLLTICVLLAPKLRLRLRRITQHKWKNVAFSFFISLISVYTSFYIFALQNPLRQALFISTGVAIATILQNRKCPVL